MADNNMVNKRLTNALDAMVCVDRYKVYKAFNDLLKQSESQKAWELLNDAAHEAIVNGTWVDIHSRGRFWYEMAQAARLL